MLTLETHLYISHQMDATIPLSGSWAKNWRNKDIDGVFVRFFLDKLCGVALYGATYVRCLMNVLGPSNSAFRAHRAGGLEFSLS
jgi:hypothetical protein